MAVKSASIRIEEEMLNNLGFVAEYEGRSLNSHILVLIHDSIKTHEEKFGAIEGEVTPDSNVSQLANPNVLPVSTQDPITI